jgi:uncharacterized surface anchored protein
MRRPSVCLVSVVVLSLLSAPTTALAQDAVPATIVITNVDANGNLLVSACWVIHTEQSFVQGACDGNDGSPDGTTTMTGIAPGTYLLIERRSPSGYVTGYRQSITLEPGQTLQVTRTDEAGGQALTVISVDQTGSPMIGVCANLSREDPDSHQFAYFVAGCDGEDGQDGITVIPGVPPGTYLVSHYNLPAGYVVGEPRSVEVKIRAGQDAQVTLTAQPGGSLTISVVDETGAAVPSGCFNAYHANDDGTRGAYGGGGCDAYDGANDGTLVVQNLAVGDYVVEQTFVDRGHRLPDKPIPVSLVQGDNQLSVQNSAGGLDLVLDTIGEKKDAVAGSCYALYRTAEEKQAFDPTAGGCDAYDGETDGRTALAGLDAGDYFLVQTSADGNHTVASDRAVTLAKGKNRKLTIEDPAGGTLALTVDDGTGKRLPGACFALTPAANPEPSNTGYYWCDSYDGKNDGKVTLGGLAAGEFVLIQTVTPPDRATAAPLPVSIALGKRQRLKISNTAAGQSTTIAVVDEKKQPVPGVCFVAYTDAGGGKRGDLAAMACDWYDAFDGTVRFSSLVPGDYVLAQTYASNPYALAADRAVTVSKGKNRKWTVEDATGGTVVVSVADDKGKRVAGGCFALLDAADPDPGSPVKSACDSSDQKRDGKATLAGLATGDYLLVQTATPAKRLSAPAQTVAVELGKKQQIKLTNPPGGQPAAVAVVDADKRAVPGGCFLLYADAGAGKRGDPVAAACDTYDATDGTATFPGLAPGSYVLAQTAAPAGYGLAADHPVVVTGDQPAALTITATAAAPGVA